MPHPADPGPVDIILDVPLRFEVADGTVVHSPMVEAAIGGVPTLLILDTGSTDHVLTRDVLDRVGVAMTPADDGADHAGAPVRSWAVGDLAVRISDQAFALRDVVAIDPPAAFTGWGVGGFLSPQHLHPSARVLMDLARDRLLIVADADTVMVDAWIAARLPSLRPLALEGDPDEMTVAVAAAIEPFGTVSTMLNTGGRGTEFSSAVVPGLATGDARRGSSGISGAGVTGEGVGPRTLLVGDARLPVTNLIVRDEMDDPPGIVGMDVLRGTALAFSSDPARGVTWFVPR